MSVMRWTSGQQHQDSAAPMPGRSTLQRVPISETVTPTPSLLGATDILLSQRRWRLVCLKPPPPLSFAGGRLDYCEPRCNARPITLHALPCSTCSIGVASLSVEPPSSSPLSTPGHVIAAIMARQAPVTAAALPTHAHPFCSSTYTSARLGYLRSALSSRCSIHALRNLLPLACALAASCETGPAARYVRGARMPCIVLQHARHGVSSQPENILRFWVPTFLAPATCATHMDCDECAM
jgi:hypothetical protein